LIFIAILVAAYWLTRSWCANLRSFAVLALTACYISFLVRLGPRVCVVNSSAADACRFACAGTERDCPGRQVVSCHWRLTPT